MECESFFPPLFEVTGVKRVCEREYGHTRTWHRITDKGGRRTEWEWSPEEKKAIKKGQSK